MAAVGDAPRDSCFRLRQNPTRHKDVIRIGCGAGFAGDRIHAALKLLKQVPNLHYLVLECLAERTLAIRYEAMAAGGKGYDPRISSWMRVLLPVALKQGVRIISNMGAMDPLGAQDEVLRISTELGLHVTVSVVQELANADAGVGCSTYLGAAPILHALETGNPDVIITTRTADAALFLAPMVYELGWNWDEFELLSQGTLTGHLLECGCQLTGGYFMQPADNHRKFSHKQLLEVSLPYADVFWDGTSILGKAENSCGELSVATCAQQLLYEIGDPCAYISPDVVVDFSNVCFEPLSEDRVEAKGAHPSSPRYPDKLLCLTPEACGTKGWGEISYGGPCCQERAAASDYLVRAWMEEAVPGVSDRILSYMFGLDSLGLCPVMSKNDPLEVRLRMDGLFQSAAGAIRFTQEFEALYTNGPAGGGGISTGHSGQTLLEKALVARDKVFWSCVTRASTDEQKKHQRPNHTVATVVAENSSGPTKRPPPPTREPAPTGVSIPLFQVAHGRTGDKGNQLNCSVIPHCTSDISRLQKVITQEWVKQVVKPLLQPGDESASPVQVYHVPGVSALNLVITNVLDGGVTRSRRIDRHGKALSDLILSQLVTLPE